MSERRKLLEKFRQYFAVEGNRVEEGIRQHRRGNGRISVVDAQGKPIPGARLQLRQKSHEFRFGCNLFMLDEFETEEKNRIYKEKFARLFNMATLPFYWDSTEPEKGKHRYDRDAPRLYRRPSIDLCMEYCEQNGIEPREHALAYDHFFPDWLAEADVETCKRELERRYREISERYAHRIPCIEVTNEMQWAAGKTAFYRADDFMDWCFAKAEEYFPDNHLSINEGTRQVYGDFFENMSLYYLQIERLLGNGRRIDAVGIQCHLPSQRQMEAERSVYLYNPDRLFRVLDRYSDFRLPLQVTEITIPAYSTDAEDEAIQADLVEYMYSLWFSHLGVEQIIYWNLPDGYAFGTAQGDMTAGENVRYGGLLRFDMSKKPAFERLEELIHRRWHTDVDVITDETGAADFCGFYGDYEVMIDGNVYSLQLGKEKDNQFVISVSKTSHTIV